jgi:hypothetical protein
MTAAGLERQRGGGGFKPAEVAAMIQILAFVLTTLFATKASTATPGAVTLAVSTKKNVMELRVGRKTDPHAIRSRSARRPHPTPRRHVHAVNHIVWNPAWNAAGRRSGRRERRPRSAGQREESE